MGDSIKAVPASEGRRITTREAVFAWVVLFLVLTSRFTISLLFNKPG